MTIRLTAAYVRGEDGYIVASVPALPGCHSQGRTLDEARRNIREVALSGLACLQTQGEQIPEEINSEQLDCAL